MGTVRNLILKLSGKEIRTDEVRGAVSKASGMIIELPWPVLKKSWQVLTAGSRV